MVGVWSLISSIDPGDFAPKNAVARNLLSGASGQHRKADGAVGKEHGEHSIHPFPGAVFGPPTRKIHAGIS